MYVGVGTEALLLPRPSVFVVLLPLSIRVRFVVVAAVDSRPISTSAELVVETGSSIVVGAAAVVVPWFGAVSKKSPDKGEDDDCVAMFAPWW
jgi:hypothetical protein